MTEHITKLETKIKELEEVCSSVGDNSELVELLAIIRRPGWTSVAEGAFANSVVESLVSQARNVRSLRSALLADAKQVGTGKTATA
jgi:hypothetical protein